MAQVAARQLAGEADAAFRGADMSTKLKLMGVDVASLGDAHCATPGSRAYVFIDERKQVYKKLVVSERRQALARRRAGRRRRRLRHLLQMMLNGIALPEQPEELILPMRVGCHVRRLGVDAAGHGADLLVQQRHARARSARPSTAAARPSAR